MATHFCISNPCPLCHPIFNMKCEGLFDVLSGNEKIFDTDIFSRTQAVPVHEEKDNWLVYVDMPGVKKEDVKISVVKGQVYITGERKGERPQVFEKFMRPGDSADLEQIDASLVNGVLEVRIRKNKTNSPRLIKVK